MDAVGVQAGLVNFRVARLLDSDFFGDSQRRKEGRKERRSRRDKSGNVFLSATSDVSALENLCQGDVGEGYQRCNSRPCTQCANDTSDISVHLTVYPPKKSANV